jgi:hypothetical protein
MPCWGLGADFTLSRSKSATINRPVLSIRAHDRFLPVRTSCRINAAFRLAWERRIGAAARNFVMRPFHSGARNSAERSLTAFRRIHQSLNPSIH